MRSIWASAVVVMSLAACGSVAFECPTERDYCGACVDLQTDLQNCGACGNVCGETERCVAGQCTITCPAGQDLCDGVCRDVATDEDNCGGCGVACSGAQSCVAGACQCAGKVCDSTCVDTQNDALNCGDCGNACVVGYECRAGSCEVSCSASLHQRIVDPWGLEWDGYERAATNLTAAQADCNAIGGRLPTGTELYRVSAVQTASVGQSFHTNYLWAGNPRDATNQLIARLSDASFTLSAIDPGTNRNYRCVCAPPAMEEFVGNSCYGAPSAQCFTLPGEGGRRNIDMLDRAPMPKSSAIWECTRVHAHVADYFTLAEGIQHSLPNGTQNWLHTADDANYQYESLIRWQNTQPSWVAASNTTVSGQNDFRPFRCVGVNYKAGTHPNTFGNEFVPPRSFLKGEMQDSSSQSWVQAHDTCNTRGGHLARSTELGELIMQGMPNGSGMYLWAADQAGYNGTQFLAMGVHWTGTANRFGFYYNSGGTGLNWAYKTDTGHASRCVYYPIDTSYMGPSDTNDCNGGCMKIQLAGTTPAIMWIDKADRPATPIDSAINTCRMKNGHLASERDLLEAIRKGLPGGTNAWLLAADVVYGDSVGAGTRHTIVRWAGVDMAFTDQYTTYMTNADFGASHPFRCMWTNELR